MSRVTGESTSRGGDPKRVLRALRKIAGGSVSQVAYSIANFVTTAAVVREYTQEASSWLVIAISMQILFTALCRGATGYTLLTTYVGTVLARRDWLVAVTRGALVALASSVATGSTLAAVGAPGTAILTVSLWVASGILADEGRILGIAYSGQIPIMLIMGATHAGLAVAGAVVADRLPLGALFGLLAALNLLWASASMSMVGRAAKGTSAPSYWTETRAMSASLSLEEVLLVTGAAAVPFALGLNRPEIAIANQIAQQAVTTPVIFALSGMHIPFAQRIVQTVKAGGSARNTVSLWVGILFISFTIAVLTAVTVGRPVGQAIFGSSWTTAAAILPFTACYIGFFAMCHAVLQPWRLRFSPRVLMSYSVLIGLAVHGAVLVGGWIWGFAGYKVGCLAGVLFGTTVWALVLGVRSRRGALRKSKADDT